MAYSGPATLAEVEADLNLSEEEDIADKALATLETPDSAASDNVLKVPPQRSTQSDIASVSLPPSASRKNRNT
ncbi:hypothetical protein Pcinc_003969 [Petrolisthes cinctipes]|uniref:Uncharacterized protein n=1 Tax=Petrolisthes cinctipes TaxID=88211 RepID=A0AAE1GME5_PETCI|nr:hypothetical protein Pcinc_003969 [Petrolisthes cinctipes]